MGTLAGNFVRMSVPKMSDFPAKNPASVDNESAENLLKARYSAKFRRKHTEFSTNSALSRFQLGHVSRCPLDYPVRRTMQPRGKASVDR